MRACFARVSRTAFLTALGVGRVVRPTLQAWWIFVCLGTAVSTLSCSNERSSASLMGAAPVCLQDFAAGSPSVTGFELASAWTVIQGNAQVTGTSSIHSQGNASLSVRVPAFSALESAKMSPPALVTRPEIRPV